MPPFTPSETTTYTTAMNRNIHKKLSAPPVMNPVKNPSAASASGPSTR